MNMKMNKNMNTKDFLNDMKDFMASKGLDLKKNTLLDVILYYCEVNEIDEEDAGLLLAKDKGICSILEREMIEEKLHNKSKYTENKKEETLEDF